MGQLPNPRLLLRRPLLPRKSQPKSMTLTRMVLVTLMWRLSYLQLLPELEVLDVKSVLSMLLTQIPKMMILNLNLSKVQDLFVSHCSRSLIIGWTKTPNCFVVVAFNHWMVSQELFLCELFG